MTDWEGREKVSSRTDSGGTASPKSETPGAIGLCATCIHWMFEEPDWEFDDINFGECKRIKMREAITETDEIREIEWGDPRREEAQRAALIAAKAVAVDGSGYYAAIRTAGDFGCTLHCPAESNASSPNEVSTSALPPDEPTILKSSIPKSAGKESAP